ncbi:hypothetical protein BDP27DRAFT_1365660 [Rhodocollybia butyracea]|uniref:Uncharacterized protein n=1 Tax=Rhodocollybia butyracea TaxID=206335 RepID=A0A9P5U4W8_9AGAR|nr:hypothetical protein BDP27DRAFT_1365660 [Rhodocollybia butyracea]
MANETDSDELKILLQHLPIKIVHEFCNKRFMKALIGLSCPRGGTICKINYTAYVLLDSADGENEMLGSTFLKITTPVRVPGRPSLYKEVGHLFNIKLQASAFILTVN